MLRTLLTATCAAALLAGCATNPTGTTGSTPVSVLPDPTVVSTDINTFATDVGAITKAICAVVPTGLTVAGLITSNPALTTAQAVAGAICGLVGSTAAPKASLHHASAEQLQLMKAIVRHKFGVGNTVSVGTYVGPNGSVPITVTVVSASN